MTGLRHQQLYKPREEQPTGESNFYKNYIGVKQEVVNVKAPIKCLGCDTGMHEQCHFTFHEQPDIHHGVEVAGNNLQEDREKGTSEKTTSHKMTHIW